MKNIKVYLGMAVLGASISACNQAPEVDTQSSAAVEVESNVSESTLNYAVNTESSDIRWVGYKTFGEAEHKGKIMMSEGVVMIEGDNVVGGDFVIDMSTISNEDLPVEGDFNQAKLIGHLSSPDFFYVEKFPTAKFTISKVEPAPADHAQGITHTLSGNLEMRGITKNITVPATVEINDNTLNLVTPEFVIDRTQWEVEALSTSISGLAKEHLVDDNIKLQIELTANRS